MPYLTHAEILTLANELAQGKSHNDVAVELEGAGYPVTRQAVWKALTGNESMTLLLMRYIELQGAGSFSWSDDKPASAYAFKPS